MQQKHIISCDWGTSSLRLKLIDTTTQQCLAKAASSEGNAVIFNRWNTEGSSNRIEYYLRHLKPLLTELSAAAQIATDDLPILISGMASSTVGLKELPYTSLPFQLDGSSAYSDWINAKSVVNNSVLLISGVQQSDDVMRGEETQLIGIASLFDLPRDDNFIFILPGTHSKHITVGNNSIISFKTYMTGEIFETLTRHTVLSHAVASSQYERDHSDAFKHGVHTSIVTELLNSLFSVRINQLKKYLSPEENYYYLSGLLIGSELKQFVSNDQQLVLCSNGSLLRLYKLAIESMKLTERTIFVPEEVLDNAAAVGQMKILNHLKSN